MTPPMLTVTDVAQQLNVGRRHVLDLIHRGELRASNVARADAKRGGKRWRISPRSVERYLESTELAA